MKLYEATDALEEVYAQLLESEGELTPEIEAALDAAEGAFEQKAEAVALKVRELMAEAVGIELEAKRLAARQKARDRAATSLKAYLHAQLERAERTTVSGKLVTVRLQKSPAAVVIPDDILRVVESGDYLREGSVWTPFLIHIPEAWRVNKALILGSWKAAGDSALPPCVRVEQGTHVRIY